MTRTFLPIAAVALSATAALLLTACGGSSKGSDTIPGANASSAPASTSPTASASGSGKRPTITLPSDAKDTFVGWTSSDSKNNAALQDSAESIKAVDAAIVQGKASTGAMRFYITGKAYESSVKWVQSFLDANLSIAGSVRYFDPQITSASGGALSLIYCGDETKAYNKNRKTGKLSNGVSSKADAYVLYNSRLEKNKQGIWQTAQLISQRGAKQCQQ